MRLPTVDSKTSRFFVCLNNKCDYNLEPTAICCYRCHTLKWIKTNKQKNQTAPLRFILFPTSPSHACSLLADLAASFPADAVCEISPGACPHLSRASVSLGMERSLEYEPVLSGGFELSPWDHHGCVLWHVAAEEGMRDASGEQSCAQKGCHPALLGFGSCSI